MRDPKTDPRPGDILRKWDQDVRVTKVIGVCVYTDKMLTDRSWMGISFFREWAADADVVHIAEQSSELVNKKETD